MKRSPSSTSRSPSSSSRSSRSNAESHSCNVYQRQTYTISTIGQKPVLDLEGPNLKCYCGKKAPLWTSWTDVNPGRRFVTCAYFNRCNFHKWVDDEMQDRAKEVIIGLRNREKELVAGMDLLADDIEELRQKEVRLDGIVTILKNDALKLKEENESLKLDIEKKLRRKNRSFVLVLLLCIFIIWFECSTR